MDDEEAELRIDFESLPDFLTTTKDITASNIALDKRMSGEIPEWLEFDLESAPENDITLALAGQAARQATGQRTRERFQRYGGGGIILAGGVMMSEYLYNKYIRKNKEVERDDKLREYYAILSANAYLGDDSILPPNIEDVSIDEYADMAKVFKHNDKVTISYRGTDPTNPRDLAADGIIMTGALKTSPRFNRALALYDEVEGKYPDSQIAVTGHSLGSSQAIHVAGNRGKTHAYGFNPGVGPTQMGGTARSTIWVTGNDLFSQLALTPFQRGKVSINRPGYGGHAMKNHLPASYGGYNKDINVNMENVDYLTFTDKELIQQPPRLGKFPQKPKGKFKDRLIGKGVKDPDYYFDGEDLVDADLGRFAIDEEDKQKLIKNTIALEGEDSREFPLFKTYIPSTFTDLNSRPRKPFRPQNISRTIDRDRNGFVSKSELLLFLKGGGYTQEDIELLYNRLDVDGDGKVSLDELQLLSEIL